MKNIVFIAFFIGTRLSFGQSATMTVENSHLRIGEQTVLLISFEYQNPLGNALVIWPEFDRELTNKVEIIDKTIDNERLIDSLTGTYLREQKLIITSFDAGTYTLPAQEIRVGDSLYKTNLLDLLIDTVPIDTSKGITDIKPIYDVKYPFSERSKDWLKENWIWIALILASILAFFSWRRYKRNRITEEVDVPKIIIPAHITALEVLEQLLQKEEWKSANKKGYYSEVTDTVRTYLEDRFEIYAMEQTTREIISDLKNSPISEEDKVYLKKILSEADMVKFAKMTPTDEKAYEMLSKSIDFVQRTKEIDK